MLPHVYRSESNPPGLPVLYAAIEMIDVHPRDTEREETLISPDGHANGS